MGKLEGTVENYLRKQAEKNNYLCYKFVSPGNNGVPDRCIIGHGKTFFVETKAPGGEPRKLQQKVIAKMQKHGATVFVIDTKEKVDRLFDTILNDEKT